MESFEQKASDRRAAHYKKGLNEDESRRRRQGGLMDLRRKERESAIAKRRLELQGNTNSAFMTKSPGADQILEFIKGINSDDPKIQYESTVSIRKIISSRKDPPINLVIKSGIIPKITSFLQMDDNQQIQYESAWIMTNIASGDTEQTATLIKSGAIPHIIRLLSSPNIEVAEQSCWAIGNISGDNYKFRDFLLNQNVVDPLINLFMRSKKPTLLRTATWTLSNLCRNKPDPDFKIMQKLLPFFSELISLDDVEVITDAAWAISFISDDNSEDNMKIQAVCESGVVPKIISYLLDSRTIKSLKTPLLRIIGNILTGNDQQTQIVIDNNVYKVFENLLQSPTKVLRKETIWAISNIAAGNSAQVGSLIQSGLVQKVFDIFPRETFDIKKEIAWVAGNCVATADPLFVDKIVSFGGIGILCDLLLTNDARTITVALEGISSILHVGQIIADQRNEPNRYADKVEELGGLDKLEQVQEMDDKKIYQLASEIVIKYFFDGDGNIDELEPKIGDGEFKFGDNLGDVKF